MLFVCIIKVTAHPIRCPDLVLLYWFAKLRISGWEMYFFSIVNINDVDDS